MEPYRITPYFLLFGTKTGYFWVCGINWHLSGSQTHEILLFSHHPPRKTWGRPNTWATVPHVCVFSHYTHSIPTQFSTNPESQRRHSIFRIWELQFFSYQVSVLLSQISNSEILSKIF